MSFTSVSPSRCKADISCQSNNSSKRPLLLLLLPNCAGDPKGWENETLKQRERRKRTVQKQIWKATPSMALHGEGLTGLLPWKHLGGGRPVPGQLDQKPGTQFPISKAWFDFTLLHISTYNFVQKVTKNNKYLSLCYPFLSVEHPNSELAKTLSEIHKMILRSYHLNTEV